MASERADLVSLPNLLYVGSDKSGSTWIFNLLASHADIWAHPAKDLYFFDRYFDRGVDWYSAQFSDGASHQYRAEVCHDYMYSAVALNRIRDTLDQARLIVCIRPPFARMRSQFFHLQRKGYVKPQGLVDDALDRYRTALVDRGLYASHVEEILDVFGPERLLVLDFRQLASDGPGTSTAIASFLGVPASGFSLPEPANRARVARSTAAGRSVRIGSQALRSLGLEGPLASVRSSALANRVLYRRGAPGDDLLLSSSKIDDFQQLFEVDAKRLSQALPDWDRGDDWLSLDGFRSV